MCDRECVDYCVILSGPPPPLCVMYRQFHMPWQASAGLCECSCVQNTGKDVDRVEPGPLYSQWTSLETKVLSQCFPNSGASGICVIRLLSSTWLYFFPCMPAEASTMSNSADVVSSCSNFKLLTTATTIDHLAVKVYKCPLESVSLCIAYLHTIETVKTVHATEQRVSSMQELLKY